MRSTLSAKSRRAVGPRVEAPVSGPQPNEPHALHWRINGHRATLYLWTPEKWARLNDRPTDAQRLPGGSWCALRMD